MCKSYLITFTPRGRFYFGGNQSFSEGFHVHSLDYPQPSTLLGTLRKNILKQTNSDYLKVDDKNGREFPNFDNFKSEIFDLTGSSQATSLESKIGDEDSNIGIIDRLSPTFLVKFKDKKIIDFLFAIPKDIEWDESKKTFRIIKHNDPIQKAKTYDGKKEKGYALLSDRDNKKSSPVYFGGEEFWKAYVTNESPVFNEKLKKVSIYKERPIVGIQRQDRVADEGRFYTKTDYSLEKGYAFGCIVFFKKNCPLKSDDVLMGGERSVFKMEIHEINETSNDTFLQHPVMVQFLKNSKSEASVKCVALSPILGEVSNTRHAIIPGLHSMRMLNEKWKTDNYLMYPTGSVFYPDGGFKLDDSDYQLASKIGYNSILYIEKGK